MEQESRDIGDSRGDRDPIPLVTITETASKVDAYVTSMKTAVAKHDEADRENIARIEALERLLERGKRRLAHIKHSVELNVELALAMKKAEEQLTSCAARLCELKSICHTNRTLSNNEAIEQVAQLIRSQIAYALDIAYDY